MVIVAELYLSEQAHKRDGFSAVFWPGWEGQVGRWEPDSTALRMGGEKTFRDGWRESISRNLHRVSGFLRVWFCLGENMTK